MGPHMVCMDFKTMAIDCLIYLSANFLGFTVKTVGATEEEAET